MGAFFTNLYIPEEEEDRARDLLHPEQEIRKIGPQWALVQSFDVSHPGSRDIITQLHGPVLAFENFDDDAFTLRLYIRGEIRGKMASEGASSGFQAFAELLPDDRSAVRKLRTLKQCASFEEKLGLLEETFGLPFYALIEDPDIRQPEKSDRTFLKVTKRAAELRKRPSRFRLTELERSEWPAFADVKMRLIAHVRDRVDAFRTHDILLSLSSIRPNEGLTTQPGDPETILFAYHSKKRYSLDYDTVIVFGRDGERNRFHLPYTIKTPLMINRSGSLIIDGIGRAGPFCIDHEGRTLWRFSGYLDRMQHADIQHIEGDEITLLSPACHGMSVQTNSRIWRISAEDGSILAFRVLPEADCPDGLFRTESAGCWVYWTRWSREAVVLDSAYREIARWPVRWHGLGFIREPYAYGSLWPDPEVIRLDLTDGRLKTIRLELPALIEGIQEDGLLYGLAKNKRIWFDPDGRMVSANRIDGEFLGIWTENGSRYLATKKAHPVPGYVDGNDPDTVRVFRVDPAMPGPRPSV